MSIVSSDWSLIVEVFDPSVLPKIDCISINPSDRSVFGLIARRYNPFFPDEVLKLRPRLPNPTVIIFSVEEPTQFTQFVCELHRDSIYRVALVRVAPDEAEAKFRNGGYTGPLLQNVTEKVYLVNAPMYKAA